MKLDKSQQFWLDAEQRRKQVVPHVWFQDQPADLFADFHGGDPQLAQADALMQDIEAHAEEFKKGGTYCSGKLQEIQALVKEKR